MVANGHRKRNLTMKSGWVDLTQRHFAKCGSRKISSILSESTFCTQQPNFLSKFNKAIGLVSSPFWQQIKSVSSKIFTQSKQGARGVNCSSSYCVNRRKTLQRLGIAMKTSSAESITPQLQICTIQIRVTPVKNILIQKEQNEIAETIMTLIVMIDQQSRHWSCSTAHRHTSKNSTNLVLRST